MGSYNSVVITTLGQQMLTDVIGTHGSITFSKFQTSSHVYPAGTDLTALTSLQDVKQTVTPSGAGVFDAVTIYVSAAISNEGLGTGYTANTLGIFASDGNTEVLFGVATGITPDVIPADSGGAPSTYTYRMQLTVSSTSSFTINIDPGAYALAGDLQDHVDSEVYSNDGVHGIRAVHEDDTYKLQIDVNGTWEDAGGSGTSIVQIPVQNTSATYMYDGTVQSIVWTTAPDAANVIVTGNTGTNAGTYTCTCTLKSAGAVWSDLTNAPKTFTWVIDKAAGSVTIPATATLDKDNLTATLAVTIVGDGTTSVTSSDTTVATVSPSTMSASGNVTVTATQKTGTVTVTATLAAGTNYTGATAACEIMCSFVPNKTFATATDEEIRQMVEAADNGDIDLYDDCGWRVGQEHTTTLGAIAASGSYDGTSWTVGEAQSEQQITLVLMQKGLYDLVTPVSAKGGGTRTKCSFVVGVKNCLETYGYINDTNTNTGSWSSSKRRAWCNGGFRSALPTDLRAVFKQFQCVTAQTYNGSTNQTTQDYFALPAAAEVFKGDATYGQGGTAGQQTAYSNLTEFNALTRFTWYETASNRIKTQGDNGSAYYWWERSPRYGTATYFCYVYSNGGVINNYASDTFGLSPFGCL